MSNEFDYTKLKHVTSVDQSDRAGTIQFKTEWAN
jgi:hypothetical protein